ncbi:hypothetical protein SAMN05444397_101741 [Flavobacterium aquidurense]|nr:hypothetical protein SAMN05444397_101741 [Flavobacterium aquidurense]
MKNYALFHGDKLRIIDLKQEISKGAINSEIRKQ